MDKIKFMINIGKNIVESYAIPVRKTVEKNQNYEIRTYEKNKYVQFKYQVVDSNNPDKKKEKKKSESKTGNDEAMAVVFKLMEYTQGSNDRKEYMKLLMPVFVAAETLEKSYKGNPDDNLVEVTIFVSLPKEYQHDKNDISKVPAEPPVPNNSSISFAVIDDFKCYVGTFGGFASDDSYKSETNKLKVNLKEAGITEFNDNKVICISYDPPFKLFGRTNEVLVLAN